MGTLEEIQRLSDGKFHRLGDDLLRRIEPRYRRLRTHGLNERGESITGQPDSYVGDTAATCVVAVCYTVQRSGWWNKVVADVREAIVASPVVSEIVIVIPHNADRDGPKNSSIDWLANARAAAGEASIRVVDGREISRHLDTDHQDLRYEHLGIPYSRLSGPSILAGCRIASQRIIDSIKASGRYDKERYVTRSADGELYRLWQAASRHLANHSHWTSPVRLIPLVSDSGVGKTSLVCEFVRKLGMVLPVLLVQARDLFLSAEDSLVASVIQSIQGFLDPSARVIEEAALCRHLAGTVPLTVVLDGLDEAHDPEAIRTAVSHWMRSNLGQSSVLIITSRREFWRTCVDPSWERWMPPLAVDERSPVNVIERQQVERNDPVAGIRLPDRFSGDELEAAWLRAGQSRQDLLTLPTDVRGELRHPFTLRVFLELRSQGGGMPPSLTRAALLECWLNRRLDAESLPRDRITRNLFQQSLRALASRLAVANSGSISVDELTDVPRFDPAYPPGPVVQRLIEANILETVPGQPDKIRFAIEAVQDFYRADADIEAISNDPASVAEEYEGLRFTTAYTRLERIGHGLADESVRDDFASYLAVLDARMAAVVVRAAAGRFSPDTRRTIAEELGQQLSTRHRVRAAMAITLLGEMGCREAVEILETQLLSAADTHPYLKQTGATAFTRLGHAPAAPFVYRWERFGLMTGNDTYYFKELLWTIRGSSLEFRSALAEEALQQISSPSGSKEHAKAVTVLAYLGDARLVANLEARLAENGLLQSYESHALIALGTEDAGALFARSVTTVGVHLSGLSNDQANHDARNRLIDRIYHITYDLRYLLTPAFEPHLRGLVESENPDVSWIASDLARFGLMASLLYPAAIAADRRDDREPDRDEQRACVTTEVWLGWWRQTPDLRLRRRLLRMLPLYPSTEIEEILIGCLDLPELCSSAARELGDYGVVRAAARLRWVLAEGFSSEDQWAKAAAARALGDLRDETAVPLLAATAGEHPHDWVVRQAVASLGLIGGEEAEHALEQLLRCGKDGRFEEKILEALLLCGSRSAVEIVVERARSRDDGPHWLFQRLGGLAMVRGWRRGEYYTHIFCDDLVDYLASQYPAGSPGQDREVERAFQQIDGPAVRRLLRTWAGLSGPVDARSTTGDGRRTSPNIYFETLRDRGDESAIDYALDERADDEDEIYVVVTADHLLNFSAAAVSRHLRLRLEVSSTASEAIRTLALLGRFGERPDAELAAGFVYHPDDMVANIACETMLRLSDPLLVPDHWREM
jgi:HEAT repeat protein